MWLLVSKDCVGSAGLGWCVWLGKSVFLKKPRPTCEASLSYSKVMACILFPRWEAQEDFWSQMDLDCNSGSPPEWWPPCVSSGGEGFLMGCMWPAVPELVGKGIHCLEAHFSPHSFLFALQHPGLLNLEAVYLFPLIKRFSFCFFLKGEVI